MVKDIRSLNAGVSGNAPDEPLNWSIASDTNILPSYGLMKTIERIPPLKIPAISTGKILFFIVYNLFFLL